MSGASQGLVLGLPIEMPEDTCLIGYADDVGALATALSAQLKLIRIMWNVSSSMAAHGLSLALNKTEVVILIRTMISTVLHLQVGDVIVETKPVNRYEDEFLLSGTAYFEDNVVKAVTALRRLMPNLYVDSDSARVAC